MNPNSNVIFKPHPGKQSLIFTSNADEILAGGGKKTGKTACAVARPLRHVNDGRFRCVFVRRTIPGLKYIETQARKMYTKIYGKNVDHNRTQHMFTFASGAQIMFTFAETLEDCDKLEGWGYQMLIVDEARQFPDPLLIDTLAAELYAENDEKTGKPWMRPTLLLLSNPGGRGGDWLRERFAIDKFPKGGVDIFDPATKKYRLYIHMTIEDNPSMDAETYIANLRRYPPWKQRQMIEGDWFQKDGAALEELSDHHYIDKYDATGCEIHRSCDWGYSTMCAIHYWAVHPDMNTTVCIDELTFTRTPPREVARECLRLERERGYAIESAVMDPSAWGEDVTGISPALAMADEGVFFRRAVNAREDGYRAITSRLATMVQRHDGKLVPAIRFVRSRCPKLLQTLPVLPQKKGEDDIDKAECKRANGFKGNDHCYDSCFTGDTLVDTSAGQVRIDSLPEEFSVMAADGSWHKGGHARLVKASADVLRITLEDGSVVTATGDHMFATESGWERADSLATCDTSGYHPVHEPNRDLGNHPGVQRNKVLSLRKLLQEVRKEDRDATAQSRVGARAWSGSKRLCRPPHQSHQDGQPTREPVGDGEQEAFIASRHGGHRGEKGQVYSECHTGCEGMAQVAGGKSLALGECKGILGEGFCREKELPCLRPGVRNEIAEDLQVLRRNLQGEGTLDEKGEAEEGLVISPAATSIEVVSVEPAGSADVYCITVPSTGYFTVNGGIVVANCRYHVMSLPSATAEVVQTERFGGLPRDRGDGGGDGSSNSQRGF